MADPRFSPAELSRSAPAPLVDEPFYEPEVEGIDLRELLDILLRGRWIILATALLTLVPVVILSLMADSMYRSQSTLLIDKGNASLADVLPSQGPASFYRGDNNLSNEILIIQQSLPLAEAVATRLLQLRRAPGGEAPLSILQPGADQDSLSVLDVAFRLQADYVSASIFGDADALQISAVSTDPHEAALIVNLYSEEFVAITRDVSRASYSEARQFLQQEVSSIEGELTEADDRVRDFMQREGAVALDEESSTLVSRLAQAQAQRDAAQIQSGAMQARLTALQSELDRLEPSLRSSFASGVSGQLDAARRQLQEVESRLEVFYLTTPSLRSDPAPGAEVARLRAEVDRLRDRTQQLADRLASQSLASGSGPGESQSGFNRAAVLRAEIADTRVALSQSQAERDQLGSRIQDYEQDLRSIPRQSIELAQLQRDRMAAEGLYSALRSNLQEAQVAEKSQIGDAQLIRPAFPSAVPYGPNRLRNSLLALILGLFAGSALAVAKVRLDHRIHRPDDVRKLGMPLLGTIPDATELITSDFEGKEFVSVNGRDIDTHMVTLLNPMAAVSESYRALRTSVQFSRPDTVIGSILVTSANPSEGKSTTALNLAAVIAQSGRRVVVIDADLRKPTIHRKMGVAREPGLVQALFAEDDSSALTSSLQEVSEDLYLLTAGATAPNPSELLGSRKMRETLASLQEDFDVVLIDAPPVLAATDAVLLSTQVDATIIVARAGSTNDYELESVTETLASVGAKTIGIVLNGFDVSQSYGYKYKYKYQYGNKYAYGAESA